MSNYAVPGQRRLNPAAFRTFNRGMGNDSMQARVFEENPDAAFAYWTKMLSPTNMQDDMLRKLYNRYYSDYEASQIVDPKIENSMTPYNWMDFLAKQNPTKDLARYSPNIRQTNTRQFTQPARWVAF